MKNKKRIFIALITVILLALLFHFKGNLSALIGAGPSAAKGFAVEVSAVIKQPVVYKIDVVGTMMSNESAEINSEVAGKVIAIHFTEGQKVKKDDALIDIDNILLKSEADEAKARYDSALSTFKRNLGLQKKGVVSTKVMEDSEALKDETEAGYKLALARLEKSKITAPFDGIIGLHDLSIGDYLSVGEKITSLESNNPMKVDFSVPEKYFGAISENQELQITVDAYPGKIFEGKVYAIDSRIDVDTRNISMRALVDNKEGLLRAGMFSYVHLILDTKQNSLLVPEEAIIPKGSEFFVFLTENGTAKITKISIGQRKNAMVEITEGLKDGDMVITAGQLKLRDGDHVAITNNELEKAVN